MESKFVYKLIEQELRRRIESGYYKPGEKIGSSKGFAKEFESSPVTVDRALQMLVESGHLKRTQRSGTFVNPVESWGKTGGHGSKSYLIGAIMFDTASPYNWAPAVKGMEQGLSDNGFHLIICNDGGDFNKAKQYVDDLSAKGIDGFIFVPIGCPTKEEYEKQNADLLNHIKSLGLPFVLYHRHLDTYDCSSVVTDNYRATRHLVGEFMDSGIRTPVCLSHYHSSVAADRERGFFDEITARGVPNPERRIFKLHPKDLEIDSSNWDEIEEALNTDIEIDGVFTVGAQVLLAAHAAQQHRDSLKKRSFRYSTFDYYEESLKSSDVMMSMIQPYFEMGRLASELLVKQMNDYSQSTIQMRISNHLIRYQAK